MGKISVIIITKNEETMIRDCLKSVSWADEIIVVDDYSTDKTLDICSEYKNVSVYQKKMSDGFGPQKDFALSKASGNWIFSIDADEIITYELKEEILQRIRDNKYDGYYLKRKNYILGKWISDHKPRNLRLFKKGKGKFSHVKVHEFVELSGKTGELKEFLIHQSKNNVDISTAFKTLDRYSTLMTENKFEKGVRMSGMQIPFRLLCMPIWYFVKKFFIHRGFMYGIRGLILSTFSSVDYFLTYAKLWEKQQK